MVVAVFALVHYQLSLNVVIVRLSILPVQLDAQLSKISFITPYVIKLRGLKLGCAVVIRLKGILVLIVVIRRHPIKVWGEIIVNS